LEVTHADPSVLDRELVESARNDRERARRSTVIVKLQGCAGRPADDPCVIRRRAQQPLVSTLVRRLTREELPRQGHRCQAHCGSGGNSITEFPTKKVGNCSGDQNQSNSLENQRPAYGFSLYRSIEA
jgi:hypothetical protein